MSRTGLSGLAVGFFFDLGTAGLCFQVMSRYQTRLKVLFGIGHSRPEQPPMPPQATHLASHSTAGVVALTGRIRHWEGEEDYFVELFNLTTGASEILKAKTSTMNHLAWLPESHQVIVGNVSKYLLLDAPAGFW